jgi:hypothetical protein
MADRITFEIPKNIDRLLATLAKLYEREEQWELENIIVNSTVRVAEGWYYDDGVHGHAVSFAVPQQLFTFNSKQKIALEEKIKRSLNNIQSFPKEYVWQVTLELDVTNGNWREQSGLLTSQRPSVSLDTEERIWGNGGHFRLFLSHVSKFKVETENQIGIVRYIFLRRAREY